MTAAAHAHRRPHPLRRRALAALAVGLVAAGAAAGYRAMRAEAFPVLVPVYSIETVSNGHRNSILGLTMGQPGVPQVPTPVDVDGDLLPDVIVAVNVIDISGAVNNPPNPGAILAPNIEIARDPTAVVRCLPGVVPLPQLSNCSPPLKVQVKLTLKDSQNLKQDTFVRFGYDTGNNGSAPVCPSASCDPLARSGSIPPYWKATVSGLDTFFNPITAAVSTRGYALLGQATNNIDLARVVNGYEGPLDLVGAIGTADGLLADGSIIRNVLNPGEQVGTDLRFSYRPWPGEVKVGYGSDGAGSHVTYEHERRAKDGTDEVDLNTRIALLDRNDDQIDATVLQAQVDRLPRRIGLDFLTGNRSGSLRYRAKADGRLPDVNVTVASEKLQAITRTEIPTVIGAQAHLDARALGLAVSADASLFLGLGQQQVDVALVPREAPLFAEVDVEALPPDLGADWAFPPDDGPARALFCAGPITGGACSPAAQGIGAVEGAVRTFYGPTSPVLAPFVPEQQQVLSFRTAPGGAFGRDSAIGGRAERVRHLQFNQSTAGFDATARAGDGELPLEVFFNADERAGGDPLVKASATIAPLPDAITAALVQPGEDQKADPLQLAYTASKSVDVNSRVEVRKPGAGAACGNAGTICGDLKVRHIPASITAKVASFDAPSDLAPSSTLFPETRVTVDAVPRPGGARPDFFADLTFGGDDNVPLVAHAELLGFPEHTSIRTREGLDETLDRVEFHACTRQFDASPPSCQAGTEQRIGSLSFSVRNWFTRPANLPILNPVTPNYGTVAVRGRPASTAVDFEATGKVTDIARLMYRNSGKIFGVSSKIGGGKPLSALIDVGDVDVADDDPANGRIDVTGETTVNPLPATLDLCVRHIGQTPQVLADEFTDECEDPKPFVDLGDTAAITKTPLSIAYRAASNFDVSAKASLLVKGTSPARFDDHAVKGTLDVTGLPREMTVHFDAPVAGGNGPIRGVSKALPGPAVNAEFSVQSTDADLVCQDPRTPALGRKALCASGRIENLPVNARFRYDPTVVTDNLLVETASAINLKKLSFSSVEGARRSSDPLDPGFFQIVPRVLVAEGEVNGLPKKVTGTLDLPKDPKGAPTVAVQASPPVGEVKVNVRNFIAPDPFIKPVPGRATGFPAPTQTVFFRQLGDDFKAEADIKSVKAFGYRTVKDAAGKALDTKVVSLDFGANQVIRAYADILADPSAHTVADVTLNDVPAGLSVCFRGKKEATTAPAAGSATYCDQGDATIPVGDDDGAFQFVGTPDSPDASPLDVDAFLRQAGGGGADILAGRVHVDNVPFVVQGTFPSGADKGTLDVGGFRRSGGGLVPDGIDRIEANLASFDLATADTGYTVPPYSPKTNNVAPFPVLATANQHLKAALKDGEFQVRARIGPQSQVQRVRMLRRACDTPSNSPPDYPFFPNDASKYTCVAGVFDPSAPDDVLDLGLHMEQNGQVLSVADAGLSDIPGRFQLTLAETALVDTTQAGDPLRRRCGTGSAEPAGTTDCMPPMVRFDQPSQSVLFGTVRAGAASDLALLEPGVPGAILPREKLADLDAKPTAGGYPGWGSSPTCQANPDTCGVRAKIVGFKGDRTAVKAGIRLGIPQSLTVDQVQSWSDNDKNGKPEYWEASDTRFHYVVRDSAGLAVGKLGQLAALKHSDDGTQILVSSPCLSRPLFRDNSTNPVRTSADDCPDFLNGVAIPGEIGIDIYQRNHTGDGKDFIQVDGRISNPGSALNLGARVLGGGPKPAIGRLEGEVLNVPTTGAGVGPGDPSFRLRVQMLGDGEAPPTGPPSPPASGTENSCSIFFCVKTEVRIKSVLASFNFLNARRVEAVVRQAGATKQGMEVKAYSGITGNALSPVTAKAFLDVNPIDVFMHAGIPLLGGADFVLRSQLHAAVGLEQVERFTLRHNTLHVKTSTDAAGSAPDSRLGPINFYIYNLHGSAYALFVKLFGIDFFPTSAPPSAGFPPGPPAGPVRLKFIDCANPATFFPGVDLSPEPNALRIPPGGSRNTVLWPFDPVLEPRVHFSGLFGTPVKLISAVAGPFFCLTGADAGDIPLPAPGDPVGPTPTASSTRAQGHPVPDATVDTSPFVVPSQPDVSPPSHTVGMGVTRLLCGSHTFTSLTVDGTLRVATAASAAGVDSTGTGPDCPAGEEGGLTLIAESITVHNGGRIHGDGIIPAVQAGGTAPTGRSGGGHGGAGGPAGGSGGGTFGDTSTNPVTEVGGRGAGGAPGAGGGAVVIRATDLVVDGGGEVTARGATGGSGAANCAAMPPVTEPGSGGGSGGGIAIAAVSVSNGGTISVRGGNGGSGGAGGGGGGGAGIVKVVSPLFSGNAVQANGGGGGGGLCGSPSGGGGNGSAPILNGSPQSLPDSPANGKFWQRDSAASDLAVPVSAAASGGAANGMEVYLCARHRTPQQVATALAANPAPDDLNSVFGMPSLGPTITQFGGVAPCGTDSPFVVTDPPVGSAVVGADRFNGTIATSGNLQDGYHGLWTVVLRRGGNQGSCLNAINFLFSCTAEVNPPKVDLVLGVDNTQPSVNITAPAAGFETRQRQVDLVVEADDQADLSTLDKVECSNDGVAFFACAAGKNLWPLAPGGDGARTITARSTDVAGNSAAFSVTGLLDTTVPAAASSLAGGVQANGWYRVPPDVSLSGSDGGSGLADPAFAFRFDEGSENPCPAPSPCPVPAAQVSALITGAHTLHFTAVDQAGNRLFDDEDAATPGPMNTRTIRLDAEKPLSAFLTVPGGLNGATPTGANGWFTSQPLATFSAVDQPGASGLVGPGAGIFYTLTSNGVVGALTQFNGTPFPLGPGQHTMCWYSVDLAGNVEPQRCSGTIKVDDAAPTVALVPTPGAPDGASGWYVTKPTVRIVPGDATPGSGINAAISPSGVFVSVDGRAFAAHDGLPITIGEGLHEVRAFTVDVSGQKSPIRAAAFMVDLSRPVTSVRVRPPDPARNDWWRRVPRVVLRSTDGERNAGVERTQFRIDGAGFADYAGAVPVPSGVHTVTFRALDRSGPANQEADRAKAVPVDVTPPVVRATTPSPTIWARTLFGPKTAKLRWTVAEDLGPNAQATVLVYNTLGQPVRRIVDGTRTVVPGAVAVTFETLWDGKDESLLGNVPVGIYYYRVVVTDEAGNTSMSAESTPIQITI